MIPDPGRRGTIGGPLSIVPQGMRFSAVLLRACRAEGINTAMETSGHAAPDIVRQLAPHVDLFLYDLKHMEPAQHKKLTGVIYFSLRRPA